MKKKSSILWTDATWSPVTGCTPKSAGCKNCYAKREVESRWSKNPKSVFFGRPFTDVQVHENQLMAPMKWKEPHRIFVCPRSDLFHESVSFEFIDWVFAVMALCPHHTFQVLTKRPERLLEYATQHTRHGFMVQAARDLLSTNIPMPKWNQIQPFQWPLKNIWLGVTAENQATANERIPLLIQTPAAVRWISAEPLIEAVDLRLWLGIDRRSPSSDWERGGVNQGIDWVVVGGESGRHARPMQPDWARTLRDQCAAAGVPYLFKQWGKHVALEEDAQTGRAFGAALSEDRIPRENQSTGSQRLLDNVMHDSYPEFRMAMN